MSPGQELVPELMSGSLCYDWEEGSGLRIAEEICQEHDNGGYSED